jgi:hypothetical protein
MTPVPSPEVSLEPAVPWSTIAVELLDLICTSPRSKPALASSSAARWRPGRC